MTIIRGENSFGFWVFMDDGPSFADKRYLCISCGCGLPNFLDLRGSGSVCVRGILFIKPLKGMRSLARNPVSRLLS
jgi:hypothetical protein